MGDLARVLGSWLQPVPALTVAAQQIKDFYLSLPYVYTHSSKQIILEKSYFSFLLTCLKFHKVGMLTLRNDFAVATLHIVEHFITTARILEATNQAITLVMLKLAITFLNFRLLQIRNVLNTERPLNEI